RTDLFPPLFCPRLVNARRLASRPSSESRAERAGPPADRRAKRARDAGLTPLSSTTCAVAASAKLVRRSERPGGARGGAGPSRARAKRRASPREHHRAAFS